MKRNLQSLRKRKPALLWPIRAGIIKKSKKATTIIIVTNFHRKQQFRYYENSKFVYVYGLFRSVFYFLCFFVMNTLHYFWEVRLQIHRILLRGHCKIFDWLDIYSVFIDVVQKGRGKNCWISKQKQLFHGQQLYIKNNYNKL